MCHLDGSRFPSTFGLVAPGFMEDMESVGRTQSHCGEDLFEATCTNVLNGQY